MCERVEKGCGILLQSAGKYEKDALILLPLEASHNLRVN
jgi:hypothetical protein